MSNMVIDKIKVLIGKEFDRISFLKEGIKHIEDLKPNELLLFLKGWNLDKEKFHVSEKVDGNNMSFGLEAGEFYVRSKNVMFKSEEEVPNLFFMKDFQRYFSLLKDAPLQQILKKLSKKYRFRFRDTAQITGEAIPSYDHNIIIYDEKKIGDGIFVIFKTTIEGESIQNQNFWKDLANEINKHTSIKFYAVPEIDLSKLEFSNDLVVSLEDLIQKHGNFLSKAARTPEAKELKTKVLAAVKELGKSAKQQVLQSKFKSLFGDEYEGLVIASPTGDLIKVVEKEKFSQRKELNWHFIDMIIKAQTGFKKRIKADPDSLEKALLEWEREIKKIERDYQKNQDQYITIPKKGRDTEQSLELDQNMILSMRKMLKTQSPDEIVQNYFAKKVVPEGFNKGISKKLLLESLLLEGGNIFKEVNSVVPKELLKTNIKYALQNAKLGDINFESIGNINKKYLGDIDIAVDKNEIKDKFKLKEEEFWEGLDKILTKKAKGRYKIVKGLRQFHLLSPLVDKHGKQLPAITHEGQTLKEPGFIQIDIFVGNLGWMKGVVSGAPVESKYKAAYRNLFLVSMFSVIRWKSPKNPDVYYKLTMGMREGFSLVMRKDIPPSGKRKKVAHEKIGEKIFSVNPDVVAQVLFGKPYQWKDINSFEKLYKLFKSPKFRFKKFRKPILEEFKKTLQRSKKDIPAGF